jgi:tetratricopeptide (TPR) repeat protein
MSLETPAPLDPSPLPELSPELRRALESIQNPATMRNAEQLETAGLTLMQAAAEWAKAHPSPDQDLEEELQRRTEALDWSGAIETLQQLTVRASKRGEPQGVFRWQQNAGNLFGLLRQSEAAQAAARAATEAARRVEDMPILLALALQNEASLNLDQGQARQALAQVTEALVQLGTRNATRLARARALTLRALCHLELGDLVAADAGLAEAGPILEPLAESPLLAGAHAGLARWHEAQARLHDARGETTLALRSQEAAVRQRGIIFEMPHIERHLSGGALAQAFLRLAEFQAQIGEPAAAEQAREEGQRIRRELRLP